jgi:hypothetical protein
MKIKHKCKVCARVSKGYAELVRMCTEQSMVRNVWTEGYIARRKEYAELSKRYADKCQCEVKDG